MEKDTLKALKKEKELGLLKSRFVTMASHEFRTPLSTILSSVFLLENYTGADYEIKKANHLKKIKRCVNNMNELLNDFLSLGKLEEGKVTVVYAATEITELLNELLSETDLIRKAGQTIEVSCKGDSTTVITDRQLLYGILRNLLSNAIKYSPPEATIWLNVAVAGQQLSAEVIDQGIGIPDGEKRAVFKRFFRGQNAVNIDGTGLGLNIAKRYVRLLKGTIQFSSQVDKGTRFVVNIPVLKDTTHENYEPHDLSDRR